MLISLIGAGNMATRLGLALKDKGHRFLQVYSRTTASAELLAKLLDAGAVTIPEQLDSEADLYICALKDDALAEVLLKMNFGKGLLVHTAGSLSMELLAGYTTNYGVFYPLQTFNKQREVDFSQIPFFIEAVLPESQVILLNLASELSSDVRLLCSEERMRLHLSAVFACNFVNYMYGIAGEILQEQGLDFNLILPLIDETTRKVHEMKPKEAQTGPAVRFDKDVMDSHIMLLAGHPEWIELYEKLSRGIFECQEKYNNKELK